MTKHKDIPVELLKEVFDYNSETGEITHKQNRRRAKKGANAVCFRKDRGYGILTYKGVKYYAHRVAWALHTGEDPGEMQIDHANKDTSDNRIENLRLATQQQNNCNRTSSNYIRQKANRFLAQCWSEGEIHYVGCFSSREECEAALIEKRRELHGEFCSK